MSRPLRDAALATLLLVGAVYVGSGRGAHLDPALFGYLGACVVAAAGATYRASAFWRRRPSAFYARALRAVVRHPGRLGIAARSAARDLVAQRFLARRSRLRWVAHLLLSLGTLASFAITVPLVFGWLHFEADGPARYRPVLLGVSGASFAVDGPVAWLAFHGLSLAAVAVLLGASAFLVQRIRPRVPDGGSASFHVAPLLLLLLVALTGLALPATRQLPRLFDVAAAAHEIAVVALLAAIPFSKLHHVLVRPLQMGARLVHAPDEPRVACSDCGDPLAPSAQSAAVRALLHERGIGSGDQLGRCPACRRRRLARTQAALVGAQFHPHLLGTRPTPPATRRAA